MWKLIWKELFLYTLTFLSISLLYRYGLTEAQQATMEQLILWCRKQSTGESTVMYFYFVCSTFSREMFVNLQPPSMSKTGITLVRFAPDVPAGILRVAGGEAVVGAVLQTALA